METLAESYKSRSTLAKQSWAASVFGLDAVRGWRVCSVLAKRTRPPVLLCFGMTGYCLGGGGSPRGCSFFQRSSFSFTDSLMKSMALSQLFPSLTIATTSSYIPFGRVTVTFSTGTRDFFAPGTGGDGCRWFQIVSIH